MIELVCVVAVSQNGVIGRDNSLPWRLRDDLARFKQLTMGLPLILGRRNHEDIGRCLPGRPNLVLSRCGNAVLAEGAVACTSLQEAIQWCERNGYPQAVVAGGGEVYRQALPLCRRLLLTRVEAVIAGDVFFAWNPAEWQEIASIDYPADERNEFAVRLTELVRPPLGSEPGFLESRLKN